MTECLFRTLQTRSESLTLEVIRNGRVILLHSKYNPEKEAENFIRAQGIRQGATVLVYGLGLGYHIRELLKCVGCEGKVYVIELNSELLDIALKYLNNDALLSDPRLSIVTGADLPEISGRLAGLLTTVQENKGSLIIHRPSLEAAPNWAAPIKELLTEWRVKKETVDRFGGLLYDNLAKNLELVRNLPGVTRLLGKFKDIPALIVGAGPSLDNYIGKLHAIEKKCFILTVGTALKPLFNNNVTPDLVLITDPQPIVYKQIQGIKHEIPLVAFPTVHPTILAGYSERKIIAFQKGIEMTENMALEQKEELIETGGSVVTAALDLAIKMGCNPIVFAGVDLGYAMGRTHTAGTMYGEFNVKEDPLLLEIPNNLNATIKAPTNLIIYRKWIESRIAREPSVRFYNLSPEGALIKGAPYIVHDNWSKILPFDQLSAKKKLRKLCLD